MPSRRQFLAYLSSLFGLWPFNDLALGAATNVSISIPDDDGMGLRGTVQVTVTAHPLTNLQRMDLYIDDVIVRSGPSSPLTHDWDTTTSSDGTHRLRGEAIYKKRKSTSQIAVTINNAAVPPPPPPPPPPSGWPWTLNGPLGTRVPLPPAGKKFLSIFPGTIGFEFDRQLQYVSEQEARIGRKYDCIVAANPPAVWGEDRLTRIAARGSLPIIAGYYWGSVADTASGAHDAAIQQMADHLKTKPLHMFRLYSEFDNPNVVYTSVGHEQEFIAAWKRVVDIFKARGATNTGFYLCPNEGHTRASADVVVAGLPDEYVDWIGVDWYNWCYASDAGCYSTPMHPNWAEFWEIFQYPPSANYSNRHDAWGPRKPWFIGETNSVYDPNAPTKRADWYRNVVRDSRALPAMEHCIGVDFYDADVSSAEGVKANFLIDSRGNAVQGFIEMAADPIWHAQGA